MKKFTFIAMLMVSYVAMTAKAQVMDKYFFKVPTDKMSEGWDIQDPGNFASTPGKDYLEVQEQEEWWTYAQLFLERGCMGWCRSSYSS